MYGAWYCYQQANECVPSYLIDKVDNLRIISSQIALQKKVLKSLADVGLNSGQLLAVPVQYYKGWC